MKKIILNTIILLLALILLSLSDFILIHEPLLSYISISDLEPVSPLDFMPDYELPINIELQEHIYLLCLEYDISYELILATLWQESGMDNTTVYHNTNGSYDSGIAQMNSWYIEWYGNLAGFEEPNFNPFNDKKAVEALIVAFDYFRSQWLNREVEDNLELKQMVLNTYNMGFTGYSNYINRNNKISRYYSDKILEYKAKLIITGSLES